MEGEGEITLSSLLEKLGVTEITAADVANVTFSNPEYIAIEQLDSDWLLRSLAPFSTEEALTLTLQNGQSVEIKVTDAVTLPANGTWDNGGNGSGTWEVDINGVLTISGTGKMKDYSSGNYVKDTPWFAYISDTASNGVDSAVTKIVISAGITRVGTNTFTRTYNLNEIDASNCSTLQIIGSSAFKQQSGSTPNNQQNPKIVNFSGCTNLATIEGQAFQDCKGIEELDISGTKLKADYITTAGAGFGSSKGSLKILKANGCTTDFTTLNLSGWNKLQTVQLSNCTNLTTLSNVTNNVTTLDVSGCTALTGLTVPTGVTTLDVSDTGITSLDLTKCTKLTSLDVSGTGIISLDLSKCTSLTSLDVSGTGITSLDLSKCKNLTSLDVSDCTDLTNLNISGCTDLTSLTVPSGVTTLNASGSGLTSLNLSASTGLTSLDTSGCAGITSLDVPNTVTTLNVSGCTALTSLNVPSGVATLNASGSGLTSLDLSAATNLNSLDTSGCTGLNSLTVPNTVTTLNVSGCTGLSSLSVPGSVTALDVSNSGLTSLDLSASTGLTSLNTSGCTGLTSLNLSACTNLTNDKLTISNSVKELDISGTTLSPNITSLKDSLETLTMSLSNTGGADLSGFTKLTTIYFDGTEDEWEGMNLTVSDSVEIILKDVEKIQLTVTAGNVSKTYDGNGTVDMSTTGLYTAVGLGEGHRIESLTLTCDSAEAGKHELLISNVKVVNSSDRNVTGRYEITCVPGELTIEPAPVTVTARNASKEYGEENPTFSATVSGLVNGEDPSLIQYGFTWDENENVGPHAITPTGNVKQGNYTVLFVTGTLTITKATVTVKADDKSKTYDKDASTDPPLTATVSGLKRGDTEDVLTYTLSRDAGESAGSYTITPSGADVQGNYHVIFRTGTLTIEPAPVTITARNAEKVYGEVDPQFTATVTGLLNGESVDLIDYAFDRASGENVGEYDIIPVAQQVQGNYRVTCENGKLNITPAAATVTADDKTKPYGTADPALTATVSDLKRGDPASVITYTLSRAEGDDVSAAGYAITPTGDAEQGNYTVTFVPGTLTITRGKATVTAEAKTKGYGEDDPELTATLSGVAESDIGKIAYTLSREPGNDMGEYVITPTGEETQGNYDVTFVPSTLTITKRKITVSGIKAKDKTYDGTTAAELDFSEAQLAGKLDGDTLSVSAVGAFADANAGENKTVTLSGLTLAGDHLENYELAAEGQQETATATITPREVTVTADDKTKAYGEADPKLTATVEGTLEGDSIAYTLSRDEGEDVGEYDITPAMEESAEAQRNYNVIFVSGKLTIAKAQAVVSVKALEPTYNAKAQALVEGICNFGDVLLYSMTKEGPYSSEIPTGENAVTYHIYYKVESTDNYDGVSGELDAPIKPARVTLTGNSDYVQYDGEEHSVSGYTCNVDGLTFPEGIAAYGSGTDVGMYEIVLTGAEAGVTTDSTGNYVVTSLVDGLLIISSSDPVTKRMTAFNGNLASYEIVVNASKDTLNNGEQLTLKDTFSQNQSINYASVEVEMETKPEAGPKDAVTFDYSGYTGTFTIPDETTVIITYTTRVSGEAGSIVSFTNTASLGRTTDGGFVGKATTINQENITITPTGSDIEGYGGEYTIRLYTYPEGHLERGLGGVEFRLLDYNQKPLVYGAGERSGEQVTFTTGTDGYVDVRLTQEQDGLYIHKNTVYYLEMIKAPVEKNGEGEDATYVYYQKDNTLYNFLITDNPSYQYGNIYSYFNNDVLKVRCYPEAQGVNVTKRFTGNFTRTNDQKNALIFVLERENTATGEWDEVERHSYAEFSYGSINFETGSKGWSRADYGRTYHVREENAEVEGASLREIAVVSSQSQGRTVSEETNEFLVDPDHDAYSFSLVFTDEYFNHKLTIYAQDEEAGTLLGGLKFRVFKADDNQPVGDIVYETNAQGTVDIQWREEFSKDTLYYVMQTEAPTGYLMPDEPEKIYFYFSGEEGPNYSWSDVLDLSSTFGTVALSNRSEKIHLPVIVAWGLTGAGTWPANVGRVEVQLYRAVDGGEKKIVEGKSVTLTKDMRFDNSVFRELPVTDENGKLYTYALIETIYDTDGRDVTDSYAVSETVSGTGWHVLRNQEAVSVTVNKAWFDLDNVTSVSAPDEAHSVKFDLYRTAQEIENAENTHDRDSMETFLAAAELVRSDLTLTDTDSWTRTESGLQKTDSAGNPYYYFALENEDSMPPNHVDSYVVAPAGEGTTRTLTLRNTKTPTTVIIRAEDKVKTYGDNDPSFIYNTEDPTKSYSFDIEVQKTGSTAVCEWNETDQKYEVTVDNTTTLEFTLIRETGEGVGSYTLKPSGDEAQKGYRLRFEDGTLTINRAPVSVKAGASKVYGEMDPELWSIEGMKPGESTELIKIDEHNREPGEDVGNYLIIVNGAEIQGNYIVSFTSGYLTITPAEATVTAKAMGKTYGEEDPELQADVTGLKRGDDPSVIQYDISRATGEDADTYPISVVGEVNQGNYTVVYENNQFTINPAPLTVSIGNLEKIYGEDDPVWEPIIDGLQGDDAAVNPVIAGPVTEDNTFKTTYTYTLREGKTLTFSVTRNSARDVAKYDVTPTGEVTQSNYTVTYEKGTLNILPADLLITADDLVRDVDDEQDPTLTATITGWRYGDGDDVIDPTPAGTHTLKDGKTLTFTLSRENPTESKAGRYLITAAGNKNQGNYAITFENGSMYILEVYNIDIRQKTEDSVDIEANPPYTYEAQVDITGTGLDSLPGFDAEGKLTFTLPDTDEKPNQKTLRIPEGAKLTVRQTDTNSDYVNAITLDGESYEADKTMTCVIENVDDYYAVEFVHSRICLPVQAMVGIDQTDEGAEPVLPMAYMPIPKGEQPSEQPVEQTIDGNFAQSFRFNLPTGKQFGYEHAMLAEADGLETPIHSVWYDTDGGVWKYRHTAEADPADVPENSVIRLYYWPKYICKIDDEYFYTLNEALEYMVDNSRASAAIKMVVAGYGMPESDALTIPRGYEITLTSADGISASINRSSAMMGDMFTVSKGAALTLSGITLDGNEVSASGAMVSSAGTLIVSTGAVIQNARSASGSALQITDGTATVNGRLINNAATANGGAVYMSGGSLEFATGCSVTGNSAAYGGVAFMTGGTLNVTGGTIGGSTANRNWATANGGAFYMEGGSLTVSGGKVNNNSAVNGGMLYATGGDVKVSKGEVKYNVADGNGGAIYYAGAGTVNVSGGAIQGNSAENGNGGAIYQNSGTVTLSSAINGVNKAKNGAAIYVAAGIANFNGGTNITGNTPTDGGAVGVDAEARLYFSGNAVINDNKLNGDGEKRNLYLDEDSDAIINVPAAGLGGSANIGVYVADNVRSTRGELNCSFGGYVNVANIEKFADDRGCYNAYASENKIWWGKPITFTVRYLSTGFPPNTGSGNVLYNTKTYYPRKTQNPIYDLVKELYDAYYSDKIGSYIYSYSFVNGITEFAKYITSIDWDVTNRVWKVKQHDNTVNSSTAITIYYSDAAFISIENNTEHRLTINPLTVMGKQAVAHGYGYTTVINNVTQTTLLSITQNHLTIEPNASVRLLFPGATDKDWAMSGTFAGVAAGEEISYILNKSGGEKAKSGTVGSSFDVLSDKTLSDAGAIYEILFGPAKPICKVENGNVEHPFETLTAAINHIQTNNLTTATIEMLVDYQQPKNDILTIPEGYDITLTTAMTKTAADAAGKTFTYYYEGEGTRATISRSSGEIGSAIVAAIQDDPDNDNQTVLYDGNTCTATTSLTVRGVIFDGKALGEGGEGGAINTANVKVSINDCKFKGYTAVRGGAIYVKWGQLEVNGSDFTDCTILPEQKSDKTGGGGIWTTAKVLTVENCNFTNCQSKSLGSVSAQGGAIFHNIRYDNAVVHTSDNQKFPTGYSNSSETHISGCSFENCTAVGSGGTIESDAWMVYIDTCTFDGSQTLKSGGNGGAINIYTNDNKNIPGTGYVEVTNCTFKNCSASNGGTNGGAIRTLSPKLKIENTTFKDVFSNDVGGAVSMSAPGTDIEIYGCTFDNCSANGHSGAIYANAYRLTIGDYGTRHTIFKNCTAPKCGGVWQNRGGDYTATVTNAQFENCSSTNDAGGALYVLANTLAMKGSSFTGCTAATNGGAVYHSGTKKETLDNCVFDSCSAQEGGGAYLSAGTLTVSGTQIENCNAATAGGGLYISPTTASFTNTKFKHNWVKATSADGMGGGLYINQGTVTMDSDCSFTNCNAPTGGGVYQNAGALTLNGTSFDRCHASFTGGGLHHAGKATVYGLFNDCIAASGGGIYSVGELTLGDTSNNATLSRCKAQDVTINAASGVATAADVSEQGNQGGGIYNQSDNLTANKTLITGCEAYDGGGVYHKAGTFTLSDGGSISGNSAVNLGGGVYAGGSFTMSGGVIGGENNTNTAARGAGAYVAAGVTMTMRGGEITHNRASQEGGGIAVGDDAKLNFSDAVQVKNNTLGEGENAADCNVHLDQDRNTVIVNAGITPTATIGVYVSDAQNDAHGLPGTPFGTYSNNASNFERFLHDREKFLYGRKGSTDSQMIWSDFVCRITDAEGNLLYKDVEHTKPAVYSALENGEEDSAFAVLAKDEPVLYTAEGKPYTETVYQVQMLAQDYRTKSQITLPAGKTVTLTTASTTPYQYEWNKYRGDEKHPVATIQRGETYGSMFRVQGELTLENILLDGNKAKNYTSTSNGGLLLVDNGTVNINTGAELRNSKVSRTGNHSSGGAVRMEGADCVVTLDGGVIRDCELETSGADKHTYGGGINVQDGELNIISGTISGCKAEYGGGIRLDTIMKMTGGSVTGNIATVEGGGISTQNSGARMNFSGSAVVQGNRLNTAEGNLCNVQVNVTETDYNKIINAQGMGEGSEIGMYVGNAYTSNHGEENKPFGTWDDDAMLFHFVNDRTELSAGKIADNDHLIYWLGKPMLVISKTVSSDWSADKDRKFNFRIELELTEPDPELLNYGFTSEGVREFQLKHGQTRSDIVLPLKMLNTKYTIREVLTEAEDRAFDTTVQKDNGDVQEAVSISGKLGENIQEGHTSTSVIKFVNTRTKADFSVNKTVLTKEQSDYEKTFYYTLTLKDEELTKYYATEGGRNESGYQLNGKLQFTNGVARFGLRHGETIRIKDLPTDLPFEIEENLTAADQKFYNVRVTRNDEDSRPGSKTEGLIGKPIPGEKEPIHVSKVELINNKLEIVCKITDRNGNLLYYRDNGQPVPAVYFRLEDAFEQVNNGGLRTFDGGTASGVLRVEMVKSEYTMEGPATLNDARTVILSTASLTPAAPYDEYPYNGGVDDGNGNTAVVYRGYDGDSMIIDNGTLTVDKITLDGNSANYKVVGTENVENSGNGGIIRVGSKRLVVNADATLRNSTLDTLNGGAIWMAEGAQLDMNGRIENCSAANGGGVYTADNLRSMSVGGTIVDCHATNGCGGAIYIGSGATSETTVTFNGATVGAAATGSGNTATQNGGAIYSGVNVIARNNTHIDGNTASQSGGGLWLAEGKTLRMSDCSVSSNTAAQNGGGMYLQGESSITNGVIDGNTASGSGGEYGQGGAVYITGDGSLTISGTASSFRNNNARLGGAIYDDASVSVSAGSMTGNTATVSGGAVYVVSGKTFSMSGSPRSDSTSITGNRSPEGAVSTGDNATLNLSGNIVIRDNTADDGQTRMNVFLGYDKNTIINTTSLDAKAEIGVYVTEGDKKGILYEHGIGARNFGSYKGGEYSAQNLNKFINDRYPKLHGMLGDAKEDGSGEYFVRWIGEDLIIQVSRFDIQLNKSTGKPITDENGKYIPVDNPEPIAGAAFTLTNMTANADNYGKIVWSGSSDKNGVVTVPWWVVESDGGNRATFEPNSFYELRQSNTHSSSVLPGGYWTMKVGIDNSIEWKTVVPTDESGKEIETVNRTRNISPSEDGILGETFTLYNDRQARITYNANGGVLASTTRNQEKTRTEEVEYKEDDDKREAVEYEIKESDPTWNTKFLKWNTEEDGSGDPYSKGESLTFCRRSDFDDVTLYAQWVPIVCKITDRDDNLLYVDGSPAIYATLKEGFDDFNDKRFTLQNGRVANPRKIKMLVGSYELPETVTLERGKTATLTTASIHDSDGYPALDSVLTADGKEICTITRAFVDGSMIINNFNLTLTSITLDGGKNVTNEYGSYLYRDMAADGGIVKVTEDYAMLFISTDAKLQNSSVNGSGAAVYVAGGTIMDMSDGEIVGNEATANGGAVYVDANAAATVSSGVLNGNTAANGAGIYLAENSTLNLSGNPDFGGKSVQNDRLVKYYSDGVPAGNFVTWGYTEAENEKNGGMQYTDIRQDIFIEATSEPHTAIRVTGEITSGDGTIWVWAEKQNHYEMLKQFAVYTGNGTLQDASMKAFRNAQPDSKTNCGGDYLTGQKGDDINGWNCIYWTGGFDVVFLKTDGSGQALPGATFTLYSDPACTTPFEMTFTSGTSETSKSTTTVSSNGNATYKDKDGKSVTLEKGEVLLSKVPPKTFYLKETAPAPGYDSDENKNAVYQVIISDTGELTMMKKDASGNYTVELFKELRHREAGDLEQYVVMNIPEAERKVILRKVNNTYASLQGAQFQIFRYDGTQVTSNNESTFTSGANGVYFIDKLSYGVYYLYEKTAPTGYTAGKWFTLTISNDNASGSRDGVTVADITDAALLTRLNQSLVKP